MIVMAFVILILMFFMGINGKSRGVVNYKFSLEIVILTIAIMPPVALIVKGQLDQFVPGLLASIIGVFAGAMIIFLILSFILGKIAKIPEYEYTGADKTLGFFAGLLKGYCIMTFLIMFYGVTFIDVAAPDVLTDNFKQNFINRTVENSIEYYRTSIYRLYIRTKGAGVEDLYSRGEQVRDYSGYVSWTGDVVIPNEVIERRRERKDKPGQPLPDIQ